MLDLNDFFLFVQVVDRGGFTGAGRTLRMPKSTLSHRIQQLEANLGVRAHSDPLPDSTLVQRTLTPAPWFLFAGAAYVDANNAPQTPRELQKHASLFMMRTGVAPVWRLRHSRDTKDKVVMPLAPRLLSDDMIGLKQAAIAGLGIVALPGYVCREDVRSGALRRVLPPLLAGGPTVTARIPYRQGLLPSVRVLRSPAGLG